MGCTDIPLTDCRIVGEGEMLLFALGRVHRRCAWKSGGLTQEQLGMRHPASGVTIAGMMVHLAKVEEMWTASAAGRAVGWPVTAEATWAGDDAEWEAAPHAAPQELYELRYGTVGRCRQEWRDLVRDGGLDTPCEDDPP